MPALRKGGILGFLLFKREKDYGGMRVGGVMEGVIEGKKGGDRPRPWGGKRCRGKKKVKVKKQPPGFTNAVHFGERNEDLRKHMLSAKDQGASSLI